MSGGRRGARYVNVLRASSSSVETVSLTNTLSVSARALAVSEGTASVALSSDCHVFLVVGACAGSFDAFRASGLGVNSPLVLALLHGGKEATDLPRFLALPGGCKVLTPSPVLREELQQSLGGAAPPGTTWADFEASPSTSTAQRQRKIGRVAPMLVSSFAIPETTYALSLCGMPPEGALMMGAAGATSSVGASGAGATATNVGATQTSSGESEGGVDTAPRVSLGLLLSDRGRPVTCMWMASEEEWGKGAWMDVNSFHQPLPSTLPYPAFCLAPCSITTLPPPNVLTAFRKVVEQRTSFFIGPLAQQDANQPQVLQGEQACHPQKPKVGDSPESWHAEAWLLPNAPSTEIWPPPVGSRHPLVVDEETKAVLARCLQRKATVIPYVGDILSTAVPHRLGSSRDSASRPREVPARLPAAPSRFIFVSALFRVAHGKALIKPAAVAEIRSAIAQMDCLRALDTLIRSIRKYQLKDCIHKVELHLFAKNPIPMHVHTALDELDFGIVLSAAFGTSCTPCCLCGPKLTSSHRRHSVQACVPIPQGGV